MRSRAVLFLGLVLFASQTFAIDRWIPVAGTVGVFHTDTRVFNPSFDKDIQVSATYYPSGNTDNSGKAPISFSVAKRSMKIIDEVTTQLFSQSQVGAILFTSSDEFEVTSRIYALTSAGTLGQFEPGIPAASAKAKGALLQLKANGTAGQTGTFRTNIGAVNPTGAPVTVNWVLYDKASATISNGSTVLPPFAVIAPTEIRSGFFFDPKSADLSDAWVSYSSPTPVIVYGSVVDNGTTDQTFVAAVDDKGVPPQAPPPQPTSHVVDVTLQNFSITVSPNPGDFQAGDQVTLRIRAANGSHGFTLVSPSGSVVVPAANYSAGAAAVSKNFTIGETGTFTYFCTNSGCGAGHSDMNGSFNVGPAPGGDGPGPGY